MTETSVSAAMAVMRFRSNPIHMMVCVAEALWLMLLLRLFEPASCLVRESQFHAVCGSAAASFISPLECANECALDPSCAGFTLPPCQLLQNLTCAEGKDTYEKQLPCPAPFAYAAAVHSCYSFHTTTAASTVQEHQSACASLHPHAHLIAIETSAEHDYIPSIPGNDGTCKYMWNGAYKAIPVAGETAEWEWDLGVAGRVPMTFSDWHTGNPNNHYGGESYVLMDRDIGYQFADVVADNSADGWFPSQTMCFVCEYDP